MKYYSIYINNSHEAILTRVKIANKFFSRLKGLLGKKDIGEDEGLLLYPSSAIHCFGMKFPIDVIFLDKKKGL